LRCAGGHSNSGAWPGDDLLVAGAQPEFAFEHFEAR
jgi:hypothetical protein